MSTASDQLRFLVADLDRAVNGRWWRWSTVPFQAGSLSVAGYRLSRATYLMLGSSYPVLHALLGPIRLLLRPFGAGLDIHYKADIGPGLLVLHPQLGVVISGAAVVGSNLTLTGGNCIGSGDGLTLGDDLNLGANAVVLGPGTVGNGVVVGAGSVLIGDAPAGATMVGSPARAAARR